MKKLSLVALAVSSVLFLPACNSEADSETDTMEMDETTEMTSEVENKEMQVATGQEEYTEVALVSEFPLADTVLKYSSEGSTNYKLTNTMGHHAEMISSNLNGRASVLQYGEGVIVALDQGDIFESDEFTLNEKSKDVLRSLAYNLKQMPDTYILVAGRADSDGSAEHNDKLAYKRAAMAANYLHGCGIDENRFFVNSYGEKYPDFKNNTSISKNKNRRVDFLIIPSNELRNEMAMR
ncbi:OmpA family protein [Jiulongibacter sediminis]|uniref:OmpA-like domain-containing protein n=1 Tax=Jiulongibacter sediminis TaxID=1605367 RepID=A0A0P7BUA0_9BACT|nr:OmpA family protein [Jiulongibacter sediminis]KPM48291.1 hypothetical protein AFM12_06450 [Jiulongibacter sediminis]TBX24831.1 hypothetical protein TK44_06455 [Jiulongibacter sediminis]